MLLSYNDCYAIPLTTMQKRKRDVADRGERQAVDTSRPTAVFKPTAGRTHTLSIALPGSIIAKCVGRSACSNLA